jgi:hypothetical protein
MMSRLTKTMTMIAVTTPLLMATLGGCVWHSKETKEIEREQSSPVVMAPPSSGPVVMSPGPAPTAPPPVAASVPTDRVVYQEGRWQLYGDGRGVPYYWVWIPTGATLTATPMPPPRPTGRVASQQVVTYPEGRWQLYGNGRDAQYYWVWIPSGVTPPTPPLPPQAG